MKIEVAYEEKVEEVKVKKHDFYYINENGGVLGYVPYDPDGEDLSYMKYQKEIGNHFKTREEAKKAVERLKAWKRLQDKGLKFRGVDCITERHNMIHFDFGGRPLEREDADEAVKDLDYIFGGEE